MKKVMLSNPNKFKCITCKKMKKKDGMEVIVNNEWLDGFSEWQCWDCLVKESGSKSKK